jgi:hypothetical protein
VTVGADAHNRETATVAERVLASELGGPVRLGPAGVLPSLQERTTVQRFALAEGPPGGPASVVVKRVSAGAGYDPAATEYPAVAGVLFNNWSALALLDEVAGDAPVAPRFHGGDRAAGLIVQEDLGAAPGLHNLLLGGDAAAAEQGLLAFAALLGRMHARTAGRHADYLRLRGALGPIVRTDFYTFAWLADAFTRSLGALDVAPASGADADVRAAIAAMRDPGPWLTLTHGDACPDNCLLVAGRPTLIDFDAAEFRHALNDGAYLRLLFPTCWCVRAVPAPLLARVEAAYRAELARGCPVAADDDAFRRALAEVCAYWVLDGFQHSLLRLLDEDVVMEQGWATLRQTTVARLEIAARTTGECGHLEALGATFDAIAVRLRARWRLEGPALPPYPAFTGAGAP